MRRKRGNRKMKGTLLNICFAVGFICLAMMDNPNPLIVFGGLGSWSLILGLTWNERRNEDCAHVNRNIPTTDRKSE